MRFFLGFWRRNWYWLGVIPATLSLVWLLLQWSQIDWLQRLVTLNFIMMLLHEFEEYGWPGGFPLIMNGAIRKSDIPDRYPLSQLTTACNNFAIAYGFYGVAALFPDVYGLGIAACRASYKFTRMAIKPARPCTPSTIPEW